MRLYHYAMTYILYHEGYRIKDLINKNPQEIETMFNNQMQQIHRCYNCGNDQTSNWDSCQKCGYTTINGKYGLHDIRIKGDWNNLQKVKT